MTPLDSPRAHAPSRTAANPPDAPLKLAAATALILFFTLCFGILTVFVETRWATALVTAVLLTLGAVWSLCFLVRPFPVRLHPALIPLAAICVLGAAQLALKLTISPWDTANEFLRWTACLAAFFLALQLGSIPVVRTRFLAALLYFGFAFSLIAAVQYLSDPSKIFGFFDSAFPGQYLGPFSNKDHYASFLQLLLPLALYEAFAATRRLLFGAVMAAIMFASVIEGASRAGSFLIVVETALLLFLAYRRKLPSSQNLVRTFVIPLFAISALTVSIGWTRLWERAHETDPYLARQQINRSSWEMIRERPLTGFGLGNYENAYPRFAHFDAGDVLSHAHNDWAEWTVEGGVPLTLLVLSAIVLSAPALWRSFWGIGVFFVFVHGFVEFPMQRPAIAFWLWVLMGLTCAAPKAGTKSKLAD